MTSEGKGPVQAILVAVFVALIAGGSAPWWWNKMFPDRSPIAGSSAPETPAPSAPLPSPQAYMGPLEGNTNRDKGDLSSNGVETNSALECSDLCLSDENCKAMTFVKHPDANGGKCWLKSVASSPIADEHMVSAIKLYRSR